MSNLRNQLDLAKAEYQSVSYPGDLASEVLGFGMGVSPGRVNGGAGLAAGGVPSGGATGQRWWWAGTGSAAAAAVLAIGFYFSQGGSRPGENPYVNSGGNQGINFVSGFGGVGNGFGGGQGNGAGGVVPVDFTSRSGSDFRLNGSPMSPPNDRFIILVPRSGARVATSPSAMPRHFQSEPNLTIRPDVRTLDYVEPHQ